MSRVVKFGLIAALAGVAVFAMVFGKWYHFTTASSFTQNEGVYADPGLEIWIDLNARMPDRLRLWACRGTW